MSQAGRLLIDTDRGFPLPSPGRILLQGELRHARLLGVATAGILLDCRARRHMFPNPSFLTLILLIVLF